MHYNEEEYSLGNKKQDVKKDQRDWVDKSSDSKSIRYILPGHTFQDEFFVSKLSSFLREVWFSK